jgi:hypothetical protein
MKDVVKASVQLLEALDSTDDDYYPEDDLEEFTPLIKPLPWWFKYLFVIGVVMFLIGGLAYYYYTPPPEFAVWDTIDPDMDSRDIPLEAGTYELWVYGYKPRTHTDFEIEIQRSYSDDYSIVKTEDDFEYTVGGGLSDSNKYWNMGDFNMEENGTVHVYRNQASHLLLIPDSYPERALYLVWYWFGIFGLNMALCVGGILLYFRFRGQ